MKSKDKRRAFSRPLEQDEVLVTSLVRYGEADCIVRLFGREKGMITAFSKNGLKPSRNRGSVVQAPARGQAGVLAKPNSEMFRLVQLELEAKTMKLTKDLKLWGWSLYVAEIIELFLPLHEPAKPVFDWADTLFNAFANGKKDAGLLRSFELKLLNFCGYLPDLTVEIDRFEFGKLDASARQAAVVLLEGSLNELPSFDETVLRQVSTAFTYQLCRLRNRPLQSVEFLKRMGV